MKTRERERLNRSGFDYGAYFQEIKLLSQLQVRPQEKVWLDRPPKDPQPVEVVLYLGCNVLRTAHLVRTVVDIFHLMGVDFVTVGGAAYCCGIVPHLNQDQEMSRQFGANSVDYFQRFRPQRVVMWCPSCIYYYDEILETPAPFPIQHVVEFLVEHLDRLQFRYPVPQRAALHYHVGNPHRDREARCAKELLAAVPGLELVEIGSDPRLGKQHCTAYVQEALGFANWERLATSFLAKAAGQGADTFATLYHGCQRFLCGYEERYPLGIEHYLTLVGRALGIEHEDKYKKYLKWGDAAMILADAAPCLRANRVDLEKARPVVQRTFLGQRK